MVSKFRALVLATSLALGLFVPSIASAACGEGPPRLLSYTFTMDYTVTSIAKFNEYLPNCGGAITNSNTAPVGSSVLTDVFAKRDPVGRTLLLGVAANLRGDPEGQQHLVLFTNTAWAASATDIAFGTLFPQASEASLVTALSSMAAGTGTDDDYGAVFGFVDSLMDRMFSPNGDPAFQFGDAFSAISFSDGQIIGSGTTSVTFQEVSAAPEPGTWAMMIVGFGVAGVALRRRRDRLQPA